MLLTIEKVLLLKHVQMFADTPDQSLASVAAALDEVELAAGDVLLRQGEIGAAMYVIADGALDVEINGTVVATLGKGEVVGELAALDPEPRTATVRLNRIAVCCTWIVSCCSS
ncbi:MAG TPA: cyclic nucleotide-binding domain-containing protein [Chloroflexota bacterium]|nr:cyclic nucleotide-binding domain-containing protein [Chloroflexota bacterium]